MFKAAGHGLRTPTGRETLSRAKKRMSVDIARYAFGWLLVSQDSTVEDCGKHQP